MRSVKFESRLVTCVVVLVVPAGQAASGVVCGEARIVRRSAKATLRGKKRIRVSRLELNITTKDGF